MHKINQDRQIRSTRSLPGAGLVFAILWMVPLWCAFALVFKACAA